MQIPSNRLTLAAVLLSCAWSASLSAQETRVIRDAPTNRQMLLDFHKVEMERAARPEEQTAVSQDSSKMGAAYDLIARATFLSFNGTMTMVPKGSIMEISENFADRICRTAGARMVDFPTFVMANRSWISTVEVSYAQARGHATINEDAKVQMKKSGNVVIATFRGNPIEVMAPAETPVETESEQP